MRQQCAHPYLEPGALTSPGLFLDRHDLEHLILQRRPQEEVDDLSLLYSQTSLTKLTKCAERVVLGTVLILLFAETLLSLTETLSVETFSTDQKYFKVQ